TTALDAGAGGIVVSDDGGHAWRGANGALADSRPGPGGGSTWGPAKDSRPGLGPIAASAGHGLVAYVGLRGLRRADGTAFNGIARTTDGGRSWRVVHGEADRPASDLEGSWTGERAPVDGHPARFGAPHRPAA